MLKYALRENLLTADENDFTAQVTDTRSYTQDDIIAQMIQRGSTLTRADIGAALQLHEEVVAGILADGGSVNTPLFNSSFSITGVFKGAADFFDRTRHAIHVHLMPGTKLKEAIRHVKTEKVQAVQTTPNITEVTDIVSGKINTTLTPSGILQAVGSRLKFDAADNEQGVFLVGETGGDIHLATVAENKPSRVMTMIPPDLAAGNYYLEIRTKVDSGNKQSKHLKTGRFDKLLQVSG